MLEIMPLLLRLLPMIVSLGSNPDIQALLQQLAKSGAVAFPDAKDPTAAASSLFDENATKWVQTALNMRLFDQSAMEVDGVYGDRTKKEVALFQESIGLTVDGWAGAKTQEALRAAMASATDPCKSGEIKKVATPPPRITPPSTMPPPYIAPPYDGPPAGYVQPPGYVPPPSKE